MKSKMFNKVTLSGYLYEHSLEEKVTGPNSKNPGTHYIAGDIGIATDENCTNIVKVHYSYVTPTNAKGANPLYSTLMDIIKGIHKTVMGDGKENAFKVQADTQLALNEFYTERDGEQVYVGAKRNEGGFLHAKQFLSDKVDDRNLFDIDMIITNVRHVDADEERGMPDKAVLKGCIFDFRKAMLPVEFSVTNATAIDYFEGLEVSSKAPVFTHLKGRQISEVIKRTIVEEGAFGEDSVKEIENTRKDFVIHWAAKEPYLWDDESTITVTEFKEAIANLEVRKAEVKARSDAYRAQKATGTTTTPTVKAKKADDGFDF